MQNSNVEILNEDFLSPDFIIPKDVNYFYFFSPFNKEEHLKVFVRKLTNHGKVNKKKITLILYNGGSQIDFYLKQNLILIHKQSFFHYFENYYLRLN